MDLNSVQAVHVWCQERLHSVVDGTTPEGYLGGRAGSGAHSSGKEQKRNFVCFSCSIPTYREQSFHTKDPKEEVPPSFVDPVPFLSSNQLTQGQGIKDALFQVECCRDPEIRKQVLGLERMLRVKAKKEVTSESDLQVAVSKKSAVLQDTSPGEPVASQAVKTQLRAKVKDAFATNKRDLAEGILVVLSARGGGEPAPVTACESDGNLGLRQVIESYTGVASS